MLAKLLNIWSQEEYNLKESYVLNGQIVPLVMLFLHPVLGELSPRTLLWYKLCHLVLGKNVQNCFWAPFPRMDIQYSMTRWGLSPEKWRKRRAVEVKVECEMYRQQIAHYWLKNGHPFGEQWLKFYEKYVPLHREMPDVFNRALNDETGWS